MIFSGSFHLSQKKEEYLQVAGSSLFSLGRISGHRMSLLFLLNELNEVHRI